MTENLQKLFNILLLSIILATVFLTLISYVLYRLQQIPGGAKREPRIRVQGVYFRRYVPHLEELETSTSVPGASPLRTWLTSRSAVVLYTVFCVVVFLSLAIPYFLGGGDRVLERFQKDASVGLETLRAQASAVLGPEAVKEFAFREASGLLQEVPTSSSVKWEKEVLASLKGRTMKLVFSERNQTKLGARLAKSLDAWEKEYQALGMKVERLNQFPATFDETSWWIVPHAISLSKAERAILEESVRERGAKILLTGEVGKLDGTLAESTDIDSWRAAMLGIEILTNPTPRSYFPTLVSAKGTPWGTELPPGVILKWFPPENGIVARLASESPAEVLLYEGNFRGEIRKQGGARALGLRLTRKKHGRGEFLYSLIEPYEKVGLTSAESRISRLVMASLFLPSKTVGVPRMVVGVDSESEFHEVARLVRVFRETGTPATFFMVSELARLHPRAMKDVLAGPRFEVASHSENHEPFESGVSLEKQFDRIEKSRLELELTAKNLGKAISVRGFHPPTETYQSETVLAASQSGMKYFFGDGSFIRLSPVLVDQGAMVLFPRVLPDDFFAVQSEKALGSEAVFGQFRAGWAQTKLVGGDYYLSLHTQIVGRRGHEEHLVKFLQQIEAEERRGEAKRLNFSEAAEEILITR
jgi:hypothetical protein